MSYLTYGPADMYETITIGEHGTMSRIHSRHGWSINMARDYTPAILTGQSLQIISRPAQAEYTLDLEYLDLDSAQRLMDLCAIDCDRGRPVMSADYSFNVRYSARDIRITEAEAIDIAQHGVHPLEVLLGPSGVTVRAVPVDLRALAAEAG